MADIYDQLNRLESPDFFIGMHFEGRPQSSVSGKQMRNFLHARLGEIDYELALVLSQQVGGDALPKWPYEADGWKILFFPIPKPRDLRGLPGVRPLTVRSSLFRRRRTVDALRSKVISKAAAYGKPSFPFVVAVNLMDNTMRDEHAASALFGSFAVTVDLCSGDVVPTRKRDGALFDRRGSRYTRVSAVLITRGLTPWNVGHADARLWHNPWARRPYEGGLARLPQAVPMNGESRLLEGESVAQILDLPEGWPE